MSITIEEANAIKDEILASEDGEYAFFIGVGVHEGSIEAANIFGKLDELLTERPLGQVQSKLEAVRTALLDLIQTATAEVKAVAGDRTDLGDLLGARLAGVVSEGVMVDTHVTTSGETEEEEVKLPTGRASFVRDVTSWRGNACVYAVIPPVPYTEWGGMDNEDVERTATHVIVSTVPGMETFAFPHDGGPSDEPADWMELDGSAREPISHAEVLSRMGYTVVAP